MLDLGKTSYSAFFLARGEFLTLVGAQNESLRLIIIYFMFKTAFGFKTILLESLRSLKTHLEA